MFDQHVDINHGNIFGSKQKALYVTPCTQRILLFVNTKIIYSRAKYVDLVQIWHHNDTFWLKVLFFL